MALEHAAETSIAHDVLAAADDGEEAVHLRPARRQEIVSLLVRMWNESGKLELDGARQNSS
jgi:hypothetical protein